MSTPPDQSPPPRLEPAAEPAEPASSLTDAPSQDASAAIETPSALETPPPSVAPSSTSAPPSMRPSAFPPMDSKRRRDRWIGLVIVAASFAVCLALSIWAKEKSRPETSEPPGPPTVDGVLGFPSEVDPIKALAAAKKLSKRPILRGIVLDGVKSDGTIDLSEGSGRGRYSFQSPAGHGAQPPREPGTLPKRITCGRQNVLLRKEGLVAEPDYADQPCIGIAPEPLPDPQCTAHDIWRLARKKRVPRDRPAHIEYYRSKAGPAWRFEITGTTHSFAVYGDCKRELSAAESYGTVPP